VCYRLLGGQVETDFPRLYSLTGPSKPVYKRPPDLILKTMSARDHERTPRSHGKLFVVVGWQRNARAELTAALEKACGGKIADCAAREQSRAVKNSSFYEATQTYGLPVVFVSNAQGFEDVAKRAPEAGYLLTTAFPSLTLAQADAILTITEGPGGGFLDNGSAFGVYSRLDLYKAAERAAAFLKEGK
jgi:hypothetical protein